MKKKEIIKRLRDKSYGGQFIGNVIEALYGAEEANKFEEENNTRFKRLWDEKGRKK